MGSKEYNVCILWKYNFNAHNQMIREIQSGKEKAKV